MIWIGNAMEPIIDDREDGDDVDDVERKVIPLG